MEIKNNWKTHLNPVLALSGYCTKFPSEEGTYSCKIHVNQGNVLFHHGCYNIETGCWDDKPEDGQDSELVIREGETKEFEFITGKHYGYTDEIWISNQSYIKPTEFICNYIKYSES